MCRGLGREGVSSVAGDWNQQCYVQLEGQGCPQLQGIGQGAQ